MERPKLRLPKDQDARDGPLEKMCDVVREDGRGRREVVKVGGLGGKGDGGVVEDSNQLG